MSSSLPRRASGRKTAPTVKPSSAPKAALVSKAASATQTSAADADQALNGGHPVGGGHALKTNLTRKASSAHNGALSQRSGVPSLAQGVSTIAEASYLAASIADEHSLASLPEITLDSADLDVPVVPMRGLVVFPGLVQPLFLGRARSVAALNALPGDEPDEELIFLAAQRDEMADEPQGADLFEVGTLARVLQSSTMPDGNRRLVVEGRFRACVQRWYEGGTHLRARVRRVALTENLKPPRGGETAALVKRLRAHFVELVERSKTLPPEALTHAEAIFAPGPLADLVASHLELPASERQKVLETLDPFTRAHHVVELLTRELRTAELDRELDLRVRESMAEGQREFLLRERLKVIQEQLGERDGVAREAQLLRKKIEAAQLSGEALERANAEVARLEKMPLGSPETSIVRTYIEWLCALPWHQRVPERFDLAEARRILDAHHAGLDTIKERIMEFLAVRKLNPQGRSPILCFVGPPGVGKTSLGKSIAEALERPFARLSLGGLHDEAEIRGHRRTYVGALPGKLLSSLRRTGAKNPVFVLDELDKLGDGRGDPASALLEALDPEQNATFADHYLEVPFDLSQVMWVATANVIERIPPALRDRLEVVRLPGYTEGEKKAIATDYLLPRQRAEHGLQPEALTLSPDALQRLIREYTREAGVRNLERELARLCRKVARQHAEAEGRTPEALCVESETLERYLGPRRFTQGVLLPRDEIGIAQGLAYTECGGDVLPIEVTLVPGSGNVKLTGNLGNVMRESCEAALTYARAHALTGRHKLESTPLEGDETAKHEGEASAAMLRMENREIPATRQDETRAAFDTHIHVPSGAVPKDGPSAGVAIASALISALISRPVRCDLTMSGEISLRGRVLAVGGIKEKVIAAHRAGASGVVLPRENQGDLEDVPREVREGLTFYWADSLEDVLNVVLVERD